MDRRIMRLLDEIALMEGSGAYPGLYEIVVRSGGELSWGQFISQWRDSLKDRILSQRGGQCDQCGKVGTQLHEAFVRRSALSGFRQFYIFSEENCTLLCSSCHAFPNKQWLLDSQRRRGYDLDDAGLWPVIKEHMKSVRRR